MNQIINCYICGAPYQFHSHYCGDQSMCGGCRAEQQRIVDSPTDDELEERRRRRRRYFHGGIMWKLEDDRPIWEHPKIEMKSCL